MSAAKIAVLSAHDNSPNLIPVVIFGGAHGSVSSEAQENLEWFREHGGLIYHHNLTFGDDLQVSAELQSTAARAQYVDCGTANRALRSPACVNLFHTLLRCLCTLARSSSTIT